MSESVHTIKLPPPRQVSPLIRTARWSLLGLGIVYGALRLKYLRSREGKIVEKNKQILTKRSQEYHEKFAEQSEKSMRQLAKEAGVSPAP